ncbi:DUF6783 domain-containing protein [Blautia wexlerae]
MQIAGMIFQTRSRIWKATTMYI